MNLKSIVLSEMGQAEKEKHCVMSLICGIPPPKKKEKKKRQDKKRNPKLIDTENNGFKGQGTGIVEIDELFCF